MMDLDLLALEMNDGSTRSFAKWTLDFVDTFYPNVGQQCYRVPALHFNQPQMVPLAGSKPYQMLKDPDDKNFDDGTAAGDLTHTFVLNNLEELSRHLLARGLGPLFIISSFNSKKLLDKERLGISCPNPLSPKDRKKQSKKSNSGIPSGEIDVLLLHKKGGIVLIEVKSVGRPRKNKPLSSTAVHRCVMKAQQQLKEGLKILHYITPDLTLSHITMVVALPYVTRQQLEIAKKVFDQNLRFLCQDDFSPPIPECSTSQTQTEEANSDRCPQDVGEPGLLKWWRNTVEAGVSSELPVDTMKAIAGRMCGPMSVVSVWTTSKPRMEVRNLAQAIGESGHRLADIVLLPRQVQILEDRSLQRLWLTGPMGSGKTLMLQLKGRQWLKEGKRVIVINVCTASRGRPQGHVLEKSIQEGIERDSRTGSVERLDIAVDEFQSDPENLHKELLVEGEPIAGNTCFVVDEVLWGMAVIPESLADRYPKSPIWCVATYVVPVPKNFQGQCWTLDKVVRSPPSIQLMLKELDLNTKHTSAYTARSAARGLASDGPPIIFIDHTQHNRQVRALDCDQCGHELADIFETTLGLKLQPPVPKDNDHLSTRLEDMSLKAASPKYKNLQKSLSFQDVLILILPPVSIYKHVKGYHWEASIPEALKFGMYLGMCKLLTAFRQRGVPFKYVVDNTQKEIAFPTKDEVIISDVMGAHSLERRVVVLLRSGDPLTLEELTENISRYQTIQADSSEIDSIRELLKSPLGSEKARGKVMCLFVKLMNEVRDEVYPELKENAEDNIHCLLGNMLVARTQSFTTDKLWKEDRLSQQTQPASETAPSTTEPSRLGMEHRCDVPLDPVHNQKEGTDASAAQRRVRNDEEVKEAVSSFFVHSVKGGTEHQQKEVERIQQAIKSLTKDEQDWEFFAASRCLSQYITIIS